jgi:hypothetical protein
VERTHVVRLDRGYPRHLRLTPVAMLTAGEEQGRHGASTAMAKRRLDRQDVRRDGPCRHTDPEHAVGQGDVW